MKKQRTGTLILLAAFGAGSAGFLAGWQLNSDNAPPLRSSGAHTAAQNARDYGWETANDWENEERDAEREVPATAPGNSAKGDHIKPSEIIDALRRHADSPRAQKMLLGMVADAARMGGAMLPEIKRMLDAGTDITFQSFKPGVPGYPSLRVALLAAAEATGDPAAVRLIADVAQTSESPVEVVFSAHMLDRLDALDPQTAQRTLDSIAKPLTPEQMKAMSSVLRKVVPAAAKADPAYAETFLRQHMRKLPGEKGMNLRLLAPVLDGLSMESARNLVLSSVNATDIPDKTKRVLAGRAAQRNDLNMLKDLRSAIESNTLPPRVTQSIASSSLGGSSYNEMRSSAFRAIKKGDLKIAQAYAKQYEARLAEATKTIQAARNSGVKLPRDTNARATLLRQRHQQVMDRLRQAYRKREREAAKAAAKK